MSAAAAAGARARLPVRRGARACEGGALPLALALALLLLLGGVAVFTLGRVHLAKASAQTGADLAALSAGRELRAALPEALGPHGLGPEGLRARALAAARAAAGSSGARVLSLELPLAGWPPTAVQVTVSQPGPMGTSVSATARAGLAAPALPAGGPVGLARGGGYSGPLVYRDGKPICPSVAAAFDLMDAAAQADGVDLVVVSGFRTDAEQAALFAAHPDPRWVAPPGRSRHRDATELDLAMAGGAEAWLRRRAPAFGFVQRYSWEPWHWGYLPGCGAPQADGGAVALPSFVPAAYAPLVRSAAARHGLPPALLGALLQAESGFDPRAVSPAGAQGIAQFMPATGRVRDLQGIPMPEGPRGITEASPE